MDSTNTGGKKGWANPNPLWRNAKWHYFKDGKSLCGRWMMFPRDPEDSNHDSVDNCTQCRLKLVILQKQEGSNATETAT